MIWTTLPSNGVLIHADLRRFSSETLRTELLQVLNLQPLRFSLEPCLNSTHPSGSLLRLEPPGYDTLSNGLKPPLSVPDGLQGSEVGRIEAASPEACSGSLGPLPAYR